MGRRGFSGKNFFPKNLDVAQWANTAAEAGMKYAILTTKYHDGFCLWPSKYTEYSVKNSPLQKDIVSLFVDEFRKVGLKVGFYYSLWDRNFDQYEDDKIYSEYMRNQIRELLECYGDIAELWFDGAWDKDHPTRNWTYNKEWESNREVINFHGERWNWSELYKMIHELQEDCLVLNNLGSDRPGEIRYMPIDIRTCEHYDFIYKEKRCIPNIMGLGKDVHLPLEYCTTLTPDWFWTNKEYFIHPSVETIKGWYQTARETNSNLLLNVGPNQEGLIPEYHQQYLKEVKKLIFK